MRATLNIANLEWREVQQIEEVLLLGRCDQTDVIHQRFVD